MLFFAEQDCKSTTLHNARATFSTRQHTCGNIFLIERNSVPLQCTHEKFVRLYRGKKKSFDFFKIQLSIYTVVLDRYRKSHGFKSRTGLNFFRSYFQLLVQWCSQLQGPLKLVSSPLCKYLNFTYLKSLFITVDIIVIERGKKSLVTLYKLLNKLVFNQNL